MDRLIGSGLADLLAGRPAIVLCMRVEDGPRWRFLLQRAGVRTLVVPLDDHVANQKVTGPTGHVNLHHRLIANLTTSPSILDDFDPLGQAMLLIPDPLNPQITGRRTRLGGRNPAGALVEDKTLVDPLWDLAGITRAASLTCDLTQAFPQISAALNEGDGIVASCQQRGHGPNSGGEGIWWWRGDRLPAGFPKLRVPEIRVRVMPLLPGLPCRVHGMITDRQIIVFPPLELLSLPRPATGTFLWAGAVPLRGSALGLTQVAHQIGTFLAEKLSYRGPFAADGILTAEGYRPTELTTRLTSAFESADPGSRVLLHAATVLARSGCELPELQDLAGRALAGDTIEVYGSSPHAVTGITDCAFSWTSDGPALSGPAHGTMTIRPWVRGWQLRACLTKSDLPAGIPIGVLAPQLFALADTVFGTGFGPVTAPFGLHVPAVRRS